METYLKEGEDYPEGRMKATIKKTSQQENRQIKLKRITSNIKNSKISRKRSLGPNLGHDHDQINEKPGY